MDTASRAEPRTGETSTKDIPASLIIAVPFYRNERLVDPMVRSLIASAEEICEANAQVILFDDSVDYPALAAALDEAVAKIGGSFPVRVHSNAVNQGWLKTCNLAMERANQIGADIILFNSDTIISPGAIREMVRVSRLDPMIGFINPRSNNATLATLPVGASPDAPTQTALAEYRIAARTLPAHSYVPTAVGFAILIRHVILSEFGYFDEIYGGGYNEENDLVMRASRCGYRAALANHAFVWHEGSATLSATNDSMERKELKNREILIRRYPEYPRVVSAWYQGNEYMAEQLLSALVPGPNGRLTVAFDFSGFGAFHSGTFKAGLQFLKHASEWQQKFNVVVLCEPGVYKFHRMEEAGIPRAEPHGPERYAAIFRVGQPFDWDSFRRMATKGAVIGTFMLDTIALDCSHLSDPSVFDLWQHTIDHSDFIAYNSKFTAQQFENRFANVRRRSSIVTLHSMEPQDYAPVEGAPTEAVRNVPEGCILVVGNQYPHKAVGDAANQIAKAFPERRVMALGITKAQPERQGAPPGVPSPVGPQNAQLENLPNLDGLTVGGLSDEDVTFLHRRAACIVMPSHYEGFGMPILMALVLKKPVFARRIPPVEEIHQHTNLDPNLHLFTSIGDLLRQLKTPPAWRERPEVEALKTDGDRLAGEVLAIVESCIAKANYATILERLRATNTVFSALSGQSLAAGVKHSNEADAAAHRLGGIVERAARPVLRFPPIYGGIRAVYNLVRQGRRMSRR
ncbi:MAG: glycosyltransferase [Hyphomonadaceae bacterium]|nr:glycosyltransferase [Hyphomonadaceae bacterium]